MVKKRKFWEEAKISLFKTTFKTVVSKEPHKQVSSNDIRKTYLKGHERLILGMVFFLTKTITTHKKY